MYPDGAIVEIRAWAVPKATRAPKGLKYSLFYINPQGQRVLGYDNAHGKGPHRHFGNREETVEFESIEKLIANFSEEVRVIRGEKP